MRHAGARGAPGPDVARYPGRTGTGRRARTHGSALPTRPLRPIGRYREGARVPGDDAAAGSGCCWRSAACWSWSSWSSPRRAPRCRASTTCASATGGGAAILLLFTVVAAERARVVRRERLPWALITLAMAAWSAGELYWVVELAPLGDDCPVPLLGRRPLARLLPAARGRRRAAGPGPHRLRPAHPRPRRGHRRLLDRRHQRRGRGRHGRQRGRGRGDLHHRHEPRVSRRRPRAARGHRRGDRGQRLAGGRASLPLVVGLALFTLSDSAYAYTIAAGTYDVGGLIDVGWVLAFGAFAIGAWQRPAQGVTIRVAHRRAAIAPAAFGALMVAILVLSQAVEIGILAVALAAAALAALVARMAAAVFELDRANAHLEEARRIAEQQSRIDPLTGLFNRRYLAERVRDELHAARAGERLGAVGLAIVDVDHFKLVNDRHGHPAGDRVLAEIAARIERAVGPDDVVGRWGGEEFCLVLVGIASSEDLRRRCDVVREAVCADPVPLDDDAAAVVTCSVGGAIGLLRLEDAMHRADRALYAAKQAGRNRTVLDGDALCGGGRRAGGAAPGPDDGDRREPARGRLVAALAAGRGAGRRRGAPHGPAAADRRALRARRARARHRQGRAAGGPAAQARPPRPQRVVADARALGGRRADGARGPRAGGRGGDRAPPPRAVRRQRLPGRPGGRRDPRRGAHRRGLRRVLGHDHRARVPAQPAARTTRSRSCAARRAATSTPGSSRRSSRSSPSAGPLRRATSAPGPRRRRPARLSPRRRPRTSASPRARGPACSGRGRRPARTRRWCGPTRCCAGRSRCRAWRRSA